MALNPFKLSPAAEVEKMRKRRVSRAAQLDDIRRDIPSRRDRLVAMTRDEDADPASISDHIGTTTS